MYDRWLPAPSAIRHAVAMLKAEPRADYAVIPMVQPGKEHSWWTVGQQVETVMGVVFIGANSFEVEEGAEVPSLAWARNAAAEIARTALAGRTGTVAWATVDRDGQATVFEDFS
jgi:hypothetical protein